MLLGRDYRPGVIDSAIQRAKLISRKEALKKVPPKINNRVIFALEYNPQLPSISGILKSAWRVMTLDPKMKKVFPEPPMLAWKRPKSLKDQLVKAKVPEQIQRSQREIQGMKKCTRPNCNTCPYVKVSKQIVSNNTGKIVSINASTSCDTNGIVYYIKCKRCNQEYIGQTGRTLAKRFGDM